MTSTLPRGRWVIASDGPSHYILEDGGIVYENERIDFTGHGYADPVDTVIINSRTVVQDRQVSGVDLAAWHTRAQQQYEKLIASYPERTDPHAPVEEIFTPSFPVVRRGG